jgi:hypothetical protein
MKRLLLVCAILTVFVVSGSWVFAQGPQQPGLKGSEPNIKCCFQDGQCLETKKDNCELKKGIMVTNCDDCPGVWGKGEKK